MRRNRAGEPQGRRDARHHDRAEASADDERRNAASGRSRGWPARIGAGLFSRCRTGRLPFGIFPRCAVNLGRGQFDGGRPSGVLVVGFAHLAFLKQIRRKYSARARSREVDSGFRKDHAQKQAKAKCRLRPRSFRFSRTVRAGRPASAATRRGYQPHRPRAAARPPDRTGRNGPASSARQRVASNCARR